MNTEELKAQIDTNITNQTEEDAITPAILGAELKAIIDVAKPYKSLVFRLSIDAGGISRTDLVNDFGNVFTMTNPSTGVVKINASADVFGLNTYVPTHQVVQGTTPYRIVPRLINVDEFDLRIEDMSGNLATPFITNQIIELRHYNS